LDLTIVPDLKNQFPDLKVLAFSVKGVKVARRRGELEEFKKLVIKEVEKRYNLETVKDVPVFRNYRDFFWKIGIDPTKNRPAAEALVRRILAGKPIPNVNTAVDACNLASIKSEVALATFDEDRIKDKLTMRFALKDESFSGIGMDKPMSLNGGEVVISDSERLVALYPHRDADYSKLTEKTRNVTILVCGVPGISLETLSQSKQIAIEYINKFCDGRTEAAGVREDFKK
jgi:DNA/RNA-binding domain of Phe-tRNA-synthetase-like protein